MSLAQDPEIRALKAEAARCREEAVKKVKADPKLRARVRERRTQVGELLLSSSKTRISLAAFREEELMLDSEGESTTQMGACAHHATCPKFRGNGNGVCGVEECGDCKPDAADDRED